MTLTEQAEELAREAEAAIPLATSRLEHIRVVSVAMKARALADSLRDTLSSP